MFRDPVLLRHGIMIVAVFHLLAQLGYGLPKILARTDNHRDVFVYYLVKERIHHHEPIYIPIKPGERLLPGEHLPETKTLYYVYPPVLSSILSFLPSMSFVAFAQFWTILLYTCFWIYSACLASLCSGNARISTTLTAGLILALFPGTQRALSLGQVDPILWSFLGIALIFPKLRGPCTIAIAMIKLWGIWPFLTAFIKNKHACRGGLLVVLFGIGVGVLGVGVAEFFHSCNYWLTHVLPTLSQGTWNSDNRSLSFALFRALKMAGLWQYEIGAFPVWAKIWLICAGVAGPALTGFFLRHRKTTVQMSAIGSAAILFAPICWTSYLPVTLTLIAALIGGRHSDLKDDQ